MKPVGKKGNGPAGGGDGGGGDAEKKESGGKSSGGTDKKDVATKGEGGGVTKKESPKGERSGAVGGDVAAGGAKPGSAGATLRDAANKVLLLAQKGEWPPVDAALKNVERLVAVGGEDTNNQPLNGVMDLASGMTPLMYAVRDNRTSILDRMIDLGADVCARNNDNYNVLHIAAMHSREDVVKLLLAKKGVDIYATGGVSKARRSLPDKPAKSKPVYGRQPYIPPRLPVGPPTPPGQPRQQTAVHLVASRQTGTATSILRLLLASAGKDIRLQADSERFLQTHVIK